MNVEQFLNHHAITENPFDQEDASTDHVFKQYCVQGARHPAWDKIYGSPQHPATAVVFGEKGSGKTALRLQIAGQLEQFNAEHPNERAFIIEYDDFNPFLDCFRERLSGRQRKADRALSNWRLWDHMDAILSLGVTRLCETIRRDESPAGGDSEPNRDSQPVSAEQLAGLSRLQKRDLLLLSAFYDHTLDLPVKRRWGRLRRKLRFHTWWAEWDRGLGIAVTLATLGLVWDNAGFTGLFKWWVAAIVLAGWAPWLNRQAKLSWTAWKVSRQIRVIDHLKNALRQILARFQRYEIAGQPIPDKDRSDDRYELLAKFQAVLKTLGFHSVVVLVDRVDEPHLVNGSPERMRDLLWPMFDNKFLKHPGIGFKLLLPIDVVYYLNREEKEFYERSRLDKQNLISSLDWTGESLYDVANRRIAACSDQASAGTATNVRGLFEESITDNELIGVFARLRVPRHLFKFMYRLLVEHCGRYPEDNPRWEIGRETLQTTLALYMRDLEAFDRGAGTG